jgi:2-polyprenyl-3-methyl-5-hydroxy-6-metoxy-1,4-benzoquinol methylase
MSMGEFARNMLGSNFSTFAKIYRSIFVDLKKVAHVLSSEISQDSRILDIGGGDGDLLNDLFHLRKDLHVTMIDIKEDIGRNLNEENRKFVTIQQNTSIDDFASSPHNVDYILVSDVLHHIPRHIRPEFFDSLFALVNKTGACLFIKDVEPKYFIATLGYLCDKYISGDKTVELISMTDLKVAANKISPNLVATETALITLDAPNYILKFEPKTAN